MELKETKLTSEPKYHGLVVDVRVDTVRLPDGRESRREVVTHPGGVAILPLTAQGEVLMVRQYRYCAGQVLLEVPAGKLEPGEEPLPAAMRELEEEVGMIAGRMEDLGYLYVSPGISTEIIHLYLATDLRSGHSCLDADEFLDVECIPLADLVEQVMAGTITDAKTAALILKTAQIKNKGVS